MNFSWTRSSLSTDKPPLGLRPKLIHDHGRKLEIVEAIHRYLSRDMNPPKEWVKELASLFENDKEC